MKQMTPRTDAAAYDPSGQGGCVVGVPFAEQLETELNETKAALEREQQDCIALRQMMRELRDALEQCSEDSIALRGEWNWKKNSGYERLEFEYVDINKRIQDAEAAITKANQLLP